MLRFIVVVYRWRDNSVDSGRLSRATGCSFLKQTAVYLASPLPFAASIHPKATLSSASCSIAYLVRNECKRHAATSAGRQVFSVGATRLAHEIHPCAVMSNHFRKIREIVWLGLWDIIESETLLHCGNCRKRIEDRFSITSKCHYMSCCVGICEKLGAGRTYASARYGVAWMMNEESRRTRETQLRAARSS